MNWDPIDQTVLANEQVDDRGRSWRSGAQVERREMQQWFLRITSFAESLLEDLPKLKWPSSVKQMQAQWIGKSDGLALEFAVSPSTPDLVDVPPVRVFTTRADVLFGVTYVAVSASHPLISAKFEILLSLYRCTADVVVRYLPEHTADRVLSFAKASAGPRMTNPSEEILLEGIDTGLFARNPLSDEHVPVFIANYVLSDYATGASMGVPAHSDIDAKFAKRHNLPIRAVLDPMTGCLNDLCAPFAGLSSQEAVQRFKQILESKNLGSSMTTVLSAVDRFGRTSLTWLFAVPPEGLVDFETALLGSADSHCLL